MNSFYSKEELVLIEFLSIGEDVLISKKASIYSAKKISIGNHVRIDDFCILSGDIKIGSHVHIAAFCALFGAYGIVMEDYTGLSPRCTIFSATDDFSGDYLISPMVTKEKTNVTGGTVIIKKYSQIGAGCIILPSVIIETGVAVGAMTLINKNLPEWSVFAGIPVKKIKERKKGLLDLL